MIIENLQAASNLEVSQRKKVDPFSLRGENMDENEDDDLDDRAMHLSGAGRCVCGNPRKGPQKIPKFLVKPLSSIRASVSNVAPSRMSLVVILLGIARIPAER